jgi:hypothetical protein
MASTRDKNSPGNYALEQFSLQKGRDYWTNPDYGHPPTVMFPGNGLLSGRVAATELATNAVDAESFLYGIGSSNLVNPPATFVAQIKKLDQVSLFKTQPVVLPASWTPDPGQRLRLVD